MLIGDARQRDLLRRAGARRATYLVSLCPDDATNADVAIQAHALAHDRRGRPLTAIIQILNPHLCHLLREWEISSTVYVGLDDDSAGLAVGLVLQRRPRSRRVPIVVAMECDRGLARLLPATSEGGFRGLRPFCLLDHTCTPELLGGSHELIGRAIHADYQRSQAALGHTPRTNPLMVPWDELDEDIKELDRSTARGLPAFLARAGLQVWRREG